MFPEWRPQDCHWNLGSKLWWLSTLNGWKRFAWPLFRIVESNDSWFQSFCTFNPYLGQRSAIASWSWYELKQCWNRQLAIVSSDYFALNPASQLGWWLSRSGSRSGLYKHYRRLYEGAAATTGYPYLEAEVRYAVTSRERLTYFFLVRKGMEVAGVLILGPQLTFSRIQVVLPAHES